VSINSAIARLSALFVLAFMLLGARALWLQAVAGPSIAADVRNPRSALLQRYRGSLLARDGTVIAHTTSAGRVYPLGAAAAQVVGYASIRYGTSGLERAFDRELSPAAASADPLSQGRALVDAFGHPLRAAQPRGADVVTTLDVAIQQELYEGISAYPRAAGVVLDPRDGQILALASVPSYDPAAVSDARFAALTSASDSPLLNRATDGLYPPGSTFKVFTAAAALDSGVVSLDNRFVDDGPLPVGTFSVHDNEEESTGDQDLTGAFALSSNVDFAQIALRLGVARWFDYAARWGLGDPLYFALPASPDHLPARDTVTPSILAQLGFGQADLIVTPLRMALLAATIADGGAEPRPVIAREVVSGTSRRSIATPGTLAQPISAQTAREVRDMMIAVVQKGTGTAAALPDVQVAGKTGTATNPAGRSHAWFVAFAPAEAPRVALAIVVENAGYGGVVAAPIARRVLAVALREIAQ
jgi:peptidoglycan glycosyltransferase